MELELPGATLSYDVAGSGPLLLLIPGGAMDSGPFAGLQAALADRFTVVRYDARGIGASRFTGGPHTITVAGQADDALALIDAVSPSEPAFVLGSSGGALTGLDLVARYPERVRRLVAHEPPLVQFAPMTDGDDDELTRIHAEQGPAAATVAFLAMAGLDGGTPADPAHLPPTMVSNFDVFFRWMSDEIGAFRVDVDLLRSRPVVVGVGEASADQMAERAARGLADALGRAPATFVGAHVGFAEDPERFARELAPLLV